MKSHCPKAELIGTAYLENYRLIFTEFIQERNRGGADIIPDKGEKVWGLIYKICEADLAILDQNKVSPMVYERFLVSVQLRIRNNYSVLENVWTYAVKDEGKSSSKKPSQDYLDSLIESSIKNDFPEYYLEYLSYFENY